MSKMTALFIGDSLIEFYDWQHRFPALDLINAGCAGETAEELLQRLLVWPAKPRPRVVVIMIGANNMVMEDYSLATTYRRIMAATAMAFPFAAIIVCGLPPLQLPWLAADAVDRINVTISGVVQQPNVHFVDLCRIFRAETGGREDTCFLGDGVHLNDRGYAIWSAALETILLERQG